MSEHALRPEADEESEATFSLDQAISAVRRRWMLIAALPLLAIAIAGVVALALPNRFDAAATVQIDPRRRAVANLEGAVSDIKADYTTIESEVEILRSKPTALKAIEILDLRADAEIAGGRSGLLGRIWPLSRLAGPHHPAPPSAPRKEQTGDSLTDQQPGQTTPERDAVVLAFASRLKVTRVRSTLLIEIRYSSADPMKAARIANTVAEVYLKEQIDAKMRAAGIAAGLLEDKLDGLRAKVTEAERRVEQFKAEHAIFDAEGQILSEKQLARLMEQTVQARNSLAEAKAKYEQTERLAKRGDSRTAIADVLQSHTIRMLKDELGKATRKEAELATKYGDRHPEMLKVRAEVADAESQLNAEIRQVISNLKNEYEVALDRERQLARDLDQLKASQVDAKEASVKLKELQREAAISKQLYEALLARHKQTLETQDLQLPDARIVERADVPLSPAGPKRKQIVLMAAVGGLVLGLGLALLLELATPGIVRPEDAERALAMDHLSSLPLVATGGPDGSGDLRAVRLMLAEPLGMFAEAVRGLRREIDVRRPRNASSVILVASGLPGEGKTSVASNLALNYAMSGVRTLLIDADLRKANLTRTLLPRAPETSLRDALERGQPIESAILRDHATGLYCLPAIGRSHAHSQASELLASQQMSEGLVRLKRHFDIIVVDCPPILPVVDARIVADLADQIVLVMAWRRTPKAMAKRALKSLGVNERKITGFVLNQVDPAEMREHAVYAQAASSASRVQRAA